MPIRGPDPTPFDTRYEEVTVAKKRASFLALTFHLREMLLKAAQDRRYCPNGRNDDDGSA
jgi:hypothetical protein